MNAFGITDKGAVRKENQDAFRFRLNEEAGELCAVLCDGMGGAQAGSIASAMAVDAFMSHAEDFAGPSYWDGNMKRTLREAVSYANIKVYDRSFTDFSCMGMGCTLVAALVKDERCLIANVGDSRAYLIHDGRIIQISRDHSLVEEMVAKGEISPEEARNHSKKNIITRAIGVEASVKCDIFDIRLEPGARLVLCSDGLSNMLTDQEILSISQEQPREDEACASMLELALSRGAPDNVTVFIAQD